MDNATIYLTHKGSSFETAFQIIQEANSYYLVSLANDNKVSVGKFLIDEETNNISQADLAHFEESPSEVFQRILGLRQEFVESQSSGLEISTEEAIDRHKPGYNPDDIYVENKSFSIQQLITLINEGDLELAPSFQRNFVWDRTRQSLLIESILLGLPLPSIYLSQYADGVLTVVDGLQRLRTVKNFFDNKLRLTNLEYLYEYEGKLFSELKKSGLSPLRLRRFGQTQIMCFIIDYRSPIELKYDLFRRLNTGGKPLNNQEIRNCLSKAHVQKALKEMCSSTEFIQATDGTLLDTRLEAQESALRFLYFNRQYKYTSNIVGEYDGDINRALNLFVEELNNEDEKKILVEVEAYKKGMRLAFYLFGNQAFRKRSCSAGRRLPINKLLMLSLTIILSNVNEKALKARYEENSLVECFQSYIDDDKELFRAITYGTNGKWNLETAFSKLRDKFFHNL